jgi:EmrB/QacA subfamily drug resistance transporter
VFLALNLSLFLSFLDSSSVSTAQPSIARDLNAGSSITWVGTSYLVANTGFQIITSRLSDIFGRKAILLGALGIFGLGDLLCGFAKTPTWLYGCRALAGIGGGGINSLSMIVLSDVVSMKTRGKYMSLLGISIALGSGVGPEVGGLLAEKATWRWVFWITPPMTAVTMVLIVFLLPLKKVPGSVTEKLKAVDWLGSVLSLGGIVMLLVPISGGGTTYAWSSPTVIALLVVGTLMLVAFICVQVWVAKLPILPLGMFKNRTVALLLVQTWFVGMVMYGNLYMAPLYLQNVLGYSPIMAGVMMIPYLVGQIVTTTIAGFVVNATGTNKPGFTIGFLLWAAGQGAQICFGKSTSVGVVVGILLLQGLGIGATLQSEYCGAAKSWGRDRADSKSHTGPGPGIVQAFRTSRRNWCP